MKASPLAGRGEVPPPTGVELIAVSDRTREGTCRARRCPIIPPMDIPTM